MKHRENDHKTGPKGPVCYIPSVEVFCESHATESYFCESIKLKIGVSHTSINDNRDIKKKMYFIF